MADKMTAERELEEQIKDAGSKLLHPPSSVDDLLPLLDQVEHFLSRVEQSPSKSMQAALSPLTYTLAADELLRHSNVDVKVAVASCISEITRITAPDAPYDDDKMKDIFQLIVSSFEDLSNESSRSYNKRAMILETVAKVRSCVVMLDLECDRLIVEMFQLFVRTIRDYHPENIFSSMETIMTLVLEESEDISHEILAPLLGSLRKDNQEVLPVAIKLAEKVFENCTSKLKPYVSQTIKSLGMSLDDYSEVVAAVCEGPSSVEHINENVSAEQPVAKDVNEACPEDVDRDVNKGTGTKVQFSGSAKEHDLDDEPPADKIALKPDVVDSDSAKEHDLDDEPSDDKIALKPEVDDSVAQKEEDTVLESRRKPSCSINVPESPNICYVDSEKKEERLPDLQESRENDLNLNSRGNQLVEVSKSLEKETVTELSSPNASETLAADPASPSLSGSLHDESLPEMAGEVKKEISIQEETPSSNLISKKTSEGKNDSEAKPHRRSGKKACADATEKDKMSAGADSSKNLGGGRSDPETKQLEQLEKKVDEMSDTKDGYSLKRNRDGKKRGHGKAATENEVTKASAKDDLKSLTRSAKGDDFPEETHRVSTKRKRTTGKDKATDNLEYGDNLVGSKVKVWWPQDREFYEGIVESFDPVKKKHKVLYNDGDEEILNFKRERWVLVDEGSVSSEEEAAETASPDGMSEMQKRKKAKRNPESSVQQGKTDVSLKSGATSSSKSKGTETKSGHKLEAEQKQKERTPKFGGKTEGDSTGKSKSRSQITGDKYDDCSKTSMKSKAVDSNTSKAKFKQDPPKTGIKSNKDTPKAAIKSKSKTPQAGGDGGVNVSGKMKHNSSQTKGKGSLKETSKEKSVDELKTPAGVKVKSSDVQEIETGSMKKRRRAG